MEKEFKDLTEKEKKEFAEKFAREDCEKAGHKELFNLALKKRKQDYMDKNLLKETYEFHKEE